MGLAKQLEEIGLTEKEARVYVALLETGEATAQQLALKSELNRATTYVILESLLKRSFIRSSNKSKKTYFLIESPQQILNFLENEKQKIDNKIDLAKNLMSELENLEKLTRERTKIKFFKGKQEVALIQKDVIRSNPKVIDNIFNINLTLENFPLRPEDHRQKIIKKKIKIRSIVIYNAKETIPQYPVFYEEERKYLPADKFPFFADMAFYKNKAAIISFKDDLAGIIIENKAIVDGLKFLFELAWQGAEKYQSLKKIKKTI